MLKKWVKPSGAMIIALAGVSALSFSTGQQKKPKKTVKHESYLDLSAFDNSVSPSKDFFEYANGGWIKKNPIPPTESTWGSFVQLRDKNRNLLHEILENARAGKHEKGSAAQMIGDFYASGMDSAAIEKEGIKPLKPEIERINALRDSKEVLAEIAHLQRNGIFPLFAIYVDQDAKNSTAYALYASQGGLGLPNRNYYTDTSKAMGEIRNKYIGHVTNMFKLLGDNEAQAEVNAKAVFNLEKGLAEASMTPVQMRDPQATYHMMKMEEVAALTPNFDWKFYLEKAGVPSTPAMSINQPEFFKKVNEDLQTVSMNDWKTYLRWHLIHNTARFLSNDFVSENFNFYGKALSGTKKIDARWKRVQGVVDGEIGDALGQEYVKKAFTPEAKESALRMVHNLEAALKDRINGLDWMSAPTKQKALDKLSKIMVKIGYPDKWKDYKGLSIDRGAYVLNVERADSWEVARVMNKLGKPVDRTEWGMTPPTVNAYYNPSMNEIVFPAGILQPPFFDAKADDAINYGGIGAVIGHELTHGFDDEGRQFDAEGNLTDWWTKEDAENFDKKAENIVKQFNGYVPVGDMHINGQLTLGENIADLGGLTIAYAAFKKAQADSKANPEAKIDGFTPDQRFFLGWAQVWRSEQTQQALEQQIRTNPHSPAKFRVNGPVSNMDAFYKAFNIKKGDPMMADESMRSRIW